MAKRILPLNQIHLLALFVFLVISVFSLRAIFATGDPVAFHDLAPMYQLDQLFRPYDFPWDYKSNLGSPSLMTGNIVYNFPFIGLSLAFGSVAFANKVLLVLLMALSGFGFYLAFTYLFKSKTGGFIAGLYMMFNPFTLTRWEFGHNTVLLAYAVFPFAVLSFFRVMKEGGRISMFVCGLLAALMIYANPQVAYLFILFALLYTVFDLAFSRRAGIIKRIITRAVQVGLIIVVALTAAFPFFYQLAMVNLPVYSTRAEEVIIEVSPTDFTGTIIPQVTLVAFAILAFFYLWGKSGFTKLYRWWKSDSADDSNQFLIKANRRQIHFFAMLGFLSVIIILLVIQPFTPVYHWLFNNLPGFGMFREVDKFFLLSAFSLAFFLGLASEGIKRYLAKNSSHLRKALPILLISLIVFASSWQFLTGDIDGNVGTVKILTAYQELDNWLSSQNGDFRIAFFPPAVWATTYTWASSRWFLDPYLALQAKPTVALTWEQDLTQAASLTRWVYSTLYSNRTNNWGKLLNVLGVKYLILRLDADMPANSSDLSAFSLANTLAAWGDQNDLQLEKNLTSILVYKNPHPLSTIYQSEGYSLIVGDRAALISLANMNFDFAKNPTAFLDDNIELTNSLINSSQHIFFQGDPYWSLLVSSLGENYIVKPWDYAQISTTPLDKWVSGDLVWYINNGNVNVAPDGYIYTNGANTITIPINVEKSSDYHVLVQVYDGLPNSQGTRFSIDNTINYLFTPTRSTEGSYQWLDIGNASLDAQSKLQISSLGGPAAISKIALIPQAAISQTVQNVSNLLQGSAARVVYLFDDRVWNFDSDALIVNPEANNGRLIDLSDSSVETKFYVFNNDTYLLNLTFQSPNGDATVKVHVDNLVKDIKLSQNASGFSTEVEIGPLDLSQGYHAVSIEAETGEAIFNMAKLSNCAGEVDTQFHNLTVSENPSYSMHSGSEYAVNTTANYVAFLEAGNGYWQLYGEGGATTQISIFNYGSLFSVNQLGSQYTLRYLGLEYVEQGVLVAAVALALILLGLKFLLPKRFATGNINNEI